MPIKEVNVGISIFAVQNARAIKIRSVKVENLPEFFFFTFFCSLPLERLGQARSKLASRAGLQVRLERGKTLLSVPIICVFPGRGGPLDAVQIWADSVAHQGGEGVWKDSLPPPPSPRVKKREKSVIWHAATEEIWMRLKATAVRCKQQGEMGVDGDRVASQPAQLDRRGRRRLATLSEVVLVII